MKDAEAKLGANHRGRQNDLNGVRLEQQVFKKPNTEDKEDGVQAAEVSNTVLVGLDWLGLRFTV